MQYAYSIRMLSTKGILMRIMLQLSNTTEVQNYDRSEGKVSAMRDCSASKNIQPVKNLRIREVSRRNLCSHKHKDHHDTN